MEEVFYKNIFCANCQKITLHVCTVDNNGELVCECPECKGFIKLPTGMTADEMNAYVAKYEVDNKGKVSIQASFDALKAFATDKPAEEATETSVVETLPEQENTEPATGEQQETPVETTPPEVTENGASEENQTTDGVQATETPDTSTPTT